MQLLPTTHKDAKHQESRAKKSHIHTYSSRHTRIYSHRHMAFFQRKTQGHGHTHGHKHTHTHPLRNIQAYRHNHTLKHRYTKAQAHTQLRWGSHTQSHRQSGARRQMSTDRQITLKDNQTQRHNRRAEGHTQAQADHPQVHSPPTPGSLWSTWGHAHRRRARGPGGPAHLAPTARPREPPGALSVRARASVPGPRARPPVGGEVRAAPGAAWPARRGGERLPWRTERDRILMGRPRALPPARRPAPSAHSFLRLSQSRPCPAARPAHPNPRANAPAGLGPGAVGRPGDGRGALRDPQKRPRPGERRRAGRGPGALRGLPGLGTGTKRALAAGSAGAVLETGVGG